MPESSPDAAHGPFIRTATKPKLGKYLFMLLVSFVFLVITIINLDPLGQTAGQAPKGGTAAKPVDASLAAGAGDAAARLTAGEEAKKVLRERIAAAPVPAHKKGEALNDALEVYQALQKEIAGFASADPGIRQMADQASLLAYQGRFKEAGQKLEAARAKESKGEAAPGDKAPEKVSHLLAMEARLFTLQGLTPQASQRYGEAAKAAQGFDASMAEIWQEDAAWEYARQGLLGDDKAALGKSAEMLKALAGKYSQEKNPEEWGRIQGKLEVVMGALGGR